jgi:hypothetical protein
MATVNKPSFIQSATDLANGLGDPMFALRIALSMFFVALFEKSEPGNTEAGDALAGQMLAHIRAVTFFVQQVSLGTYPVKNEELDKSRSAMLAEHARLIQSAASIGAARKTEIVERNTETGQMKQFQFYFTRTFMGIGRYLANRAQTSNTKGIQTTTTFDEETYEKTITNLATIASRYPFTSGMRQFKMRRKAEACIALIVSLFATAVVMSADAAAELNLAVLRGIKYRLAPVAPAPAPAPEMGAAPAPSQYGGVPAALPPIARIPPPLPSVYKN